MDIRTFFVIQDREKSTDSVQGAVAQESIDSVEGQESTVSVERPNNPLSPYLTCPHSTWTNLPVGTTVMPGLHCVQGIAETCQVREYLNSIIFKVLTVIKMPDDHNIK